MTPSQSFSFQGPVHAQAWRKRRRLLLSRLMLSLSLLVALQSAQAGLPPENECPTLSPEAKKGEESEGNSEKEEKSEADSEKETEENSN